MRSFFVVCYISLFALVSFAKVSSGAVSVTVSVTVAEVAGHVITSRDVEISSVMDHWFLLRDQNAATKSNTGKTKSSTKPPDYRDWILDIKSEAFKKQLSNVMAEELVVVEAENFSVARLSKGDIEGAAHALNESLKSWPEWQALEVSESELESQVTRHLRAKEFIKFKSESMGLQVSDDDARAYYEKNRVRFNNLPFENFKVSIKEYLTSVDIQAKMKDWFEVLRKKYKVKILPLDTLK